MILIAGGTGYIGSHTNKILNKSGYETVVYDNLGRGHREFAKWGHFVLGDLADKDQLRLCFKTYPIEAVMHFCAFCYVGESVDHPSEYYRNNVVNTLNLLDVMVEFGVNTSYFLPPVPRMAIPSRSRKRRPSLAEDFAYTRSISQM
jgi:UDP-glucose 4-epimerase